MKKPLAKIGTKLSISEIHRNVVTLSDYSSYAVRLADRWKLWFWSEQHNVILTENMNYKHPYKLRNTDVSFVDEIFAKIITTGISYEIEKNNFVKKNDKLEIVLTNLIRGVIASLPFGPIIERLIFGSIDETARAEDTKMTKEMYMELRRQGSTLEEILIEINNSRILSSGNKYNIPTLISTISDYKKGKKRQIPNQIRNAFYKGIEDDPLSAYIAEMQMDVMYWRGLGLSRDILIEDIYVSSGLTSSKSEDEDDLSESTILSYMLGGDLNSKKVLIEGEPGTGKTTLMKHWAYKVSERVLGTSNDCFPIFLPLMDVEVSCASSNNWNITIPQLLEMGFSTTEPHTVKKLQLRLSEAIKAGRAIIFLDAADEITINNQKEMRIWLKKIFHDAKNCSIVITSRSTSFIEGFEGFLNYYMTFFGKEQQKEFIQHWFKHAGIEKKAKKMIKYMQRPENYLINNYLIAGNPLFLTMMCIEFEILGSISSTPAKLIDQFSFILIDKWPKLKGIYLKYPYYDLKKRVLQTIASQFFETNQISLDSSELINATRKELNNRNSNIEPEEFIREIADTSGFIIQNRYGNWQFSHLLFQEFFTAGHHLRLKKEGFKQNEWFKSIGMDPRYVKVIDFYNQLEK